MQYVVHIKKKPEPTKEGPEKIVVQLRIEVVPCFLMSNIMSRVVISVTNNDGFWIG
jgi:hypothetical protein